MICLPYLKRQRVSCTSSIWVPVLQSGRCWLIVCSGAPNRVRGSQSMRPAAAGGIRVRAGSEYFRRRMGRLATVSLLLALTAKPAAALQKVTYLLPAPAELPNQGPLVLAQALGLYAKSGYDVSFMTAGGGVDVAKQVGIGNAPIGNALGDTAIIVRANGVPVRTVALEGGGSLSIVVG